MLDLNLSLNANSTDSTHDSDSPVTSEKFPEGSLNQMVESGTSSSSVVNADGSGNCAGDEDLCSTRADDVLTFNFDILKVEGLKDTVTKELFPVIEGGAKGVDEGMSGNWQWLATTSFPPRNESANFSFCQLGGESEMKMTQPQQLVKKSRRGPKSRNSQYRGVNFYRRTGRWESHIWFVNFL